MRTSSCGRDPAFLADRLAKHRRAFSGKTDSKGFDVEAFTSYEEAIAWLSGEAV